MSTNPAIRYSRVRTAQTLGRRERILLSYGPAQCSEANTPEPASTVTADIRVGAFLS
jgi:hypothetical protein